MQEMLRSPADDWDHVAEAGPVIVQAIAELESARRRAKEESSLRAGAKAVPGEPEARDDAQERLPVLPPIRDKSFEQAVFTHPGVRDDVHANYDRLEFLGDAYVELVATQLIWSRFSNFPSGGLSQMRETLVKNETLAEYAEMYGFDRRALVPKDYSRQSKGWNKTKGDIFESYVAAAILSDPMNGYPSVAAWLTQLWTPKLTGLVHENVSLQAKETLAKRVMAKGVKLQYVDEREPIQLQGGLQTFFVGVYLTGFGWTGRHLGSGKGSNKARAGDQAAQAALLNTVMIDEIAAAKASWIMKDNC